MYVSSNIEIFVSYLNSAYVLIANMKSCFTCFIQNIAISCLYTFVKYVTYVLNNHYTTLNYSSLYLF